jgi:hypothetical protein
MIAEIIKFLLVNFTVTLFVLGLAAAGVRIARTRTRTGVTTTGAVLDYFILFSIGVSYTWNFVVHSVFGDFSAKVIGWAQSPFQPEVAFASLGFALVGFLAFPRRRELLLKLAWAHHRALTRESVTAGRRRTVPEPVQPGAL